ncbi:hypothetical protein EIP86_007287 [Pleurotus ostreatoroseus]|nr:hypothetical protein EIP86_007287 [Pleurotus ostreatoroseus]
MSAGSVTLGGNLSIAIGPLGRNGEASGALSTKGKVAAMYSYSKTRGLFGGVSLEGSVIVERSDANSQAYRHNVTARMLLSGSVPPPEWASSLIQTLESCTGMPGNHRWVNEHFNRSSDDGYMFDGLESPRDRDENRRRPSNSRSNSYFDFNDDSLPPGDGDLQSGPTNTYNYRDKSSWARGSQYDKDRNRDRSRQDSFDRDEPTTEYFDTRFDSDYSAAYEPRRNSQSGGGKYPFQSMGSGARSRSSTYAGSSSRSGRSDNPFDDTYGDDFGPRRSNTRSSKSARGSRSYDFGGRDHGGLEDVDDHDVFGAPIPSAARAIRGSTPPPARFTPKPDLTRSLGSGGGIAKAIALFDFNAVQSGDLSFRKGDVIVVTEKSDNVDTWWHGNVGDRTGTFPANFVEVV